MQPRALDLFDIAGVLVGGDDLFELFGFYLEAQMSAMSFMPATAKNPLIELKRHRI